MNSEYLDRPASLAVQDADPPAAYVARLRIEALRILAYKLNVVISRERALTELRTTSLDAILRRLQLEQKTSELPRARSWFARCMLRWRVRARRWIAFGG